MCGRTGLNTVGSCERATTTCPPFLRLSAASTTLRSSRGPSARAAPAPPKRPRAARRESSLTFEGSLPSGRREKSAGTRVMGVPPGRDYAVPPKPCQGSTIPRPRKGRGQGEVATLPLPQWGRGQGEGESQRRRLSSTPLPIFSSTESKSSSRTRRRYASASARENSG